MPTVPKKPQSTSTGEKDTPYAANLLSRQLKKQPVAANERGKYLSIISIISANTIFSTYLRRDSIFQGQQGRSISQIG